MMMMNSGGRNGRNGSRRCRTWSRDQEMKARSRTIPRGMGNEGEGVSCNLCRES